MMKRTRKEYLVLKSDRAGDAGIVGVFSSKRKARTAVEADAGDRRSDTYWLVVLAEDRPVTE